MTCLLTTGDIVMLHSMVHAVTCNVPSGCACVSIVSSMLDHAGFRAAASQPDVAAAAAAVVAGPSLQQSASDAAVPMHQASASNQSADSGSDSASPQEAMDLQQALKIVSKHYVARNSFSPLCLLVW